MASKGINTFAFVLSLNLLFFTLVTSTYDCSPPPPPKTPKCPCSNPPKSHNPPKYPPKTPSPPKYYPPAPAKATCPRDTLKLGACADLLGGLLHIVVGTPPVTPCCSLIEGLADLEAAVCLCTAITANVLGINLNVPVSLTLLLNVCGKNVPSGFQCA